MISESFDKLKDFMFINYRGTLIERAGDRYRYRDFTGSLDEVKKRIEKGLSEWGNRIKQQNKIV